MKTIFANINELDTLIYKKRITIIDDLIKLLNFNEIQIEYIDDNKLLDFPEQYDYSYFYFNLLRERKYLLKRYIKPSYVE